MEIMGAMKQSLEALKEINKLSVGEHAICLPAEIDTAMDALRQAIEQAEQAEPVARKPLTDEEADELVRRFARYELLRAIEAAHGITGEIK